ncbi:MAG: helix-turn-helix domain-containing protein [Ignavibacteriales bacterium]|nr:helix-turn-helix domain-containing protein [Ignavibacteriales bacterium]
MQTRLILQVPNMIMVVNPLILLLGPFVYFYVKSLTNINWKFSVKLLIHFIPATAFYIYFLPVYILNEQEKFQLILDAFQNHKFIIPKTFYIITIAQIFIYIVYSIKLLYQHSKYIKNNFSFIERLNLNWLKRLLVIFIFLWLAFALRSLYPISMIWEISALLSILTMYIVGYFGYNQPVIFPESLNDPLSALNKEEKKKYATSTLTENEITEYVKKLQALMNSEKIFLKSDLKIGDVAEKMDLPVYYVSQVINEKLGKNFYDFVNEYRVDEVKKRFADTKNDYLTILAIGFDSGFNSKSAFYSAFKRNTGMIPSEFKKHLISR